MTTKNSGSYYVFEGVDGSGKTTQAQLFLEHLRNLGRPAEMVREPGDTEAGEMIRQILLSRSVQLSTKSEVDLFSVARQELRIQKIQHYIASGIEVISDRSWFSTAVYQHFGRDADEKVSIEYIEDVSKAAMEELYMPDSAVIIDVPISVALQRRGVGHEDDRYESRAELLCKVIEGYRWLAQEFDIPLIDGNQPVATVQAAVNKALGVKNQL